MSAGHTQQPPSDTDWSAEVAELEARRAHAEGLGGSDAVARHHAQGRLTIRERIAGLVDADSFQEVGKLTGEGRYGVDGLASVTPAPYVMGVARIDGRPVAVGGEDFTVRGGTSWSGDRRKGGQGGFIEDLAAQYRIPLVNLIDGAGGSVTSIRRRGHAVFPGVHGFERSVELLGTVPVVSAVMGAAAGGIAFLGSTNHLIRFFERSRDRLFDEHVNAGLEQSARDFTVHLGRHCDAGGIYLADQRAPISGPINFSFAAAFTANRAGGFFVQIADRDKFGQTLGSESRVDACMLAAKTTGSDDGCA